MQDELQISEAQAVYLEKFLHFQGSIASFAAEMDIPLVDMIDILSAPPTKQRLKAAAKLTKLKRKIIVTEIEITALKTLEQIAKNTHTPILERRRAASSILRTIHKPKPRRYRYPPTPRPPSQPQPPSPPNNPPPPPPSEDLDDSDDPTINYFDELLTQLQETTNHTSTDPSTDLPTDHATDLPHPDGPCPPPSQNRAHQEAASGQTNHNKPHFTNPTIENETIPTLDQIIDDYDPQTDLTTLIKNHTSKPQQSNHKTPYPEKDNPWESHPFALAGRTSNHDPP